MGTEKGTIMALIHRAELQGILKIEEKTHQQPAFFIWYRSGTYDEGSY